MRNLVLLTQTLLYNHKQKSVISINMSKLLYPNFRQIKTFGGALASPAPTPGMGNLLVITGRINCGLSMAGRKQQSIYPKVLPLSFYEG